MKKIYIFAAAFVFLATSIQATDFRIDLRMSYFHPSDQAFRDIYGGGLKWGGEASISLGKGWAAWLEAGRFAKEGHLTLTGEETRIQIVPLGIGIRYSLRLQDRTNLHAGGGVQYFMFDEDNLIGEVRENKLGFLARMGIETRITRNAWINVFGEYSYCRMKPAEFKFDIGGPAAGIGLGYEF